MSFRKNAAILGIGFDDGQFSAVLVDGPVHRRAQGTLAVDPLTDDPALVAQELREQLAPLGRLPRRVVVCLPLNRVLTTAVDVPEMPADLVAGFLRLQAETEFLLPPAGMVFGSSGPGSEAAGPATLMAMALEPYDNLRRTLRLLGWKRPVVTVVPVPLAPRPAETGGVGASLLVGPRWVDLVVCGQTGIALLRRLAGAVPDSQWPQADIAAVAGELRLSLGQLPSGLRARLGRVAIVGSPEPVRKLQAQLCASSVGGLEYDCQEMAPDTTVLARAVDLASGQVRNQELALTLAPLPATSQRRVWMRWNRRQLTWAAAGVLLAIGLVAALGLRQQRQLHHLQSAWAAMEPRAQAVRQILGEVKAREPWLSDQPLSLDILRAVTLAFPERGTVWTTRLEIKERTKVGVSGKALNREAWLQVLDQLRQNPGVRDLRVSQAREPADGKAPMTFALSFTWRTPSSKRDAALEVTP